MIRGSLAIAFVANVSERVPAARVVIPFSSPRDDRFIMSDAVIHRRTLIVVNDQGLHFRPCQMIAVAAQQHPGSVILSRGSIRADAKSLLELLTLVAEKESVLELEVTGDQGDELAGKMSELFSSGFEVSHPPV